MKMSVKTLKKLIKETLEDVNELKLGLSTAPSVQQTKQAAGYQKPQRHKEEDLIDDDDIDIDISDFDQLKR